MKSTNYKATILHKSSDNKLLVIGTEDGELFAFDLYDSLQNKVDPNLSSYVLAKLKNGNSFSAGSSIMKSLNVEQETVDLKLFVNDKSLLFRLGFSELYKTWLVSEIKPRSLK